MEQIIKLVLDSPIGPLPVFHLFTLYSEPSLQQRHLFQKMLPIKRICCCTEYLMSRSICKKGLGFFFFFFLFPHIEHMFWIFVRIASLRQQISKTNYYVSSKYWIQFSCIICGQLLPLKRRLCGCQIVIKTNLVVVSSVGKKWAVCTSFWYAQFGFTDSGSSAILL